MWDRYGVCGVGMGYVGSVWGIRDWYGVCGIGMGYVGSAWGTWDRYEVYGIGMGYAGSVWGMCGRHGVRGISMGYVGSVRGRYVPHVTMPHMGPGLPNPVSLHLQNKPKWRPRGQGVAEKIVQFRFNLLP